MQLLVPECNALNLCRPVTCGRVEQVRKGAGILQGAASGRLIGRSPHGKGRGASAQVRFVVPCSHDGEYAVFLA